ncbi:MAG TPA: thioredoxin family protein [Burkholderiales bacterium]|nr:thioredoxin family protein [Burkholderiales bacterium]
MSRLLALATLALCTALAPAAAAPVRTPHVEAELIAERTAVVPGEPLTVALRLSIIPGWHTYWRNPGDSGEPTRLEWRLPAGFRAGEIEWPVPDRLPVGPLMNFGYKGEALHLVRIDAPPDLAIGTPVTLSAKAWWLVCEVHCIPEDAELSITLPVASRSDADPRGSGPIAAARAHLPAPASALSDWRLTAGTAREGVALRISPPSGVAVPGARFFPFDEGKIEPADPQQFVAADGGYRLTLARAAQPVGTFDRVAGVLVLSSSGDAAPRAFTIDVPVAASAPAPSAASRGLIAALVAAFAGGLILNLMPCVLPVLAIKVLGFASHVDARTGRRHGMFYAAGVLVSFWALAGALLALRSAGAELGWGFQLQSPVAVAALALLFFALALNLSGVFEFGSLLPSRLAAWSARRPAFDWFLTGMLAVLIAAPCTAPFMGAALGFALTADAATAFSVFTALGIGMALPYVALAWFPAWFAHMPKPGPWMVRLKQALAFPLYATVVWLAWVLGRQAGLDAVIWLLAATVIVAVAAWLAGLPGNRGPLARGVSGLLAAGALAVAVFPRDGAAPLLAGDGAWQPYSAQTLTALTAAGKPVFVEFTAAWCVTCQVNKKLVLSRHEVLDAFRVRGVQLVRADWTRRDPEIAQALAGIGRSGVPAYVLYRPGREPLVLPEILTRERVIEALDG